MSLKLIQAMLFAITGCSDYGYFKYITLANTGIDSQIKQTILIHKSQHKQILNNR